MANKYSPHVKASNSMTNLCSCILYTWLARNEIVSSYTPFFLPSRQDQPLPLFEGQWGYVRSFSSDDTPPNFLALEVFSLHELCLSSEKATSISWGRLAWLASCIRLLGDSMHTAPPLFAHMRIKWSRPHGCPFHYRTGTDSYSSLWSMAKHHWWFQY